MAWEVGKQKLKREFKDINQLLEEKEGYLEENEAKLLLYKFLRENPSFATELFTGVKLFPFQHMAIKAMMESDYFLGIWSRGMSKSFSTAIFALLARAPTTEEPTPDWNEVVRHLGGSYDPNDANRVCTDLLDLDVRCDARTVLVEP